MAESDLCSTLIINKKDLDNVCSKLIRDNIITRLRSKKNGGIIYTLNKRFFDLEDLCANCKLLNIKKQNFGEGKISVWACDRSNDSPICCHDYIRSYYNVIKMLRIEYEKVGSVELLDRKFSKKRFKYVDDWNQNDFISFFLNYYKEIYPTLMQPSITDFRRKIKNTIKMFKNNVGRGWRRLCKYYILNIVNCSKGDLFKISPELTSSISINRYLTEKSTKKLQGVEFCAIRSIYCSFYKNGKCELLASGVECTDMTLKKMKEKYN